MTLKDYREKRSFSMTPEPTGSTDEVTVDSASYEWQKRFVVQEHHASRHHFDFRLEMPSDFLESDEPTGLIVLKSWAVPKGISNNKGEKRLGIMVEDHPVDYITFEGTIPEGQYGAGTVSIWDSGTYEIIQKKPSGIKLTLNGNKLGGEFHLVKTKRGKGNEWLIFK